jgi:integrase
LPGGVGVREAQRLAWDEVLSTLDTVSVSSQTLMTVERFVGRHFVPEHVNQLRQSGKHHYGYILKQIIGDPKSPEKFPRELAATRLRDLSTDDLQDLINRKVSAGLSPQTVRHIKNALSAILSHVAGKGWTVRASIARVRVPANLPSRERRALSPQQARAVLAELPSPSREMALLSIACSLNVAEMLGLQWKRVNLTTEHETVDGDVLRPLHLLVGQQVYGGKVGPTKTAGRRRQVPVPDAVVAALNEIRRLAQWGGADDYVFCTATGKPHSLSNLAARQLKPAGRKLGLPWLSWHVFRRTHATLSEIEGIPLSDRIATMGHTNAGMTMRYTISDEGRHREALGRMVDGLLEGEGGNVN